MKFINSMYLALAMCFLSTNVNCMKAMTSVINTDQVIQLITRTLLLDESVSFTDALRALNPSKLAQQLNIDADLVHEALDIMIAQNTDTQPDLKFQMQQMVRNLAPDKRNNLRGFVIGAGSTVITWLVGHALFHNLMEACEPTGILKAGTLAAITAYLVYKGSQKLNVPRTVQDVAMSQAVPLTLYAVDKMFGDDETSTDTKKSE